METSAKFSMLDWSFLAAICLRLSLNILLKSFLLMLLVRSTYVCFDSGYIYQISTSVKVQEDFSSVLTALFQVEILMDHYLWQ